MPEHVAIIGNGVAGVTAARFIRKWSDRRITIISDESDHHYSRPALMYIYMGHMRYQDTKPYEDHFWAKNRIDLVRGFVETIDTDAQRLHLRDGDAVDYDVLILATGAHPRFVGWPGEDLDGVQGMVSLQDLEQMEARTPDVEQAVVVGGGLIGVEMAEMLHTRDIPVTFLVRESGYFANVLPPEEQQIINQEIRDHGIDLRLETELKEILGDEHGQVRAVVTNHGEEIPCQFVGITIGVTPTIDVVERSAIATNRGVLVDEYFRTNVPNVYAVGDCNEFKEEGIGHRKIDLLWYTGRRHGKTVAKTICGHPTPYDRGIFFNSAKFFGVEYQTYGDIPPTDVDGIESQVWKDPEARMLIRINYEAETQRVTGFNLLGVRFRHDVCERWLQEERSLPYVIKHLREACFNPEFFRSVEYEFIRLYNLQHPTEKLKLERKPGLLQRIFA
ncbi:MAG: FAD-dependent oxidoreductase [Bacteroidetes bacterium]|nr:FAD-dependent oxidoreductase [Bacteroidota bacterium]